MRRLELGGTVIGLFDRRSYEEGSVALRRGELFLAYSDGVTEPENDFGEFGEQRLIDLVWENRDLPLAPHLRDRDRGGGRLDRRQRAARRHHAGPGPRPIRHNVGMSVMWERASRSCRFLKNHVFGGGDHTAGHGPFLKARQPAGATAPEAPRTQKIRHAQRGASFFNRVK